MKQQIQWSQREQRMNHRRTARWVSRPAAFTLVELLVVISIVSLLISILLPALGKTREEGRKTVCKSNLRSLSQISNMYHNDYKDYFAPVDAPASMYLLPFGKWQTCYAYYLATTNLSGFGTIAANGWNAAHDVFDTRITCPSKLISPTFRAIGNPPAGFYSFGMNIYLGPNANPMVSFWRTLSRLPKPSQTLELSEAGTFFGGPTLFALMTLDPYSITTPYTDWHDGVGNNILWTDGHVTFWNNVSLLNSTQYAPSGSEDKWSPGYNIYKAQ